MADDVLGAERVGDAWTDPRNPIVKIFGGDRLELWSLRPVQKHSTPETTRAEWTKQELDRFALSRFDKHAYPLPMPASAHALVRRLHFDLIGLPPSPEVMEKVEQAIDTPELERLVDQLLDSPRFGEHWARHWLDLARYSDSNGFDWDEFRTQAWRYRDYVIRSLNADKPFDQFIREQLAGDEMLEGAPRDVAEQDLLLATGFLRMGPHDNAAKLFNEQDRSRDELLTDLVETTGTAFLGLTLSCCRCHDHKFDPLSQADHFRLRACFANVEFADELAIDLQHEQQEIEQHNAAIDQQIAMLEGEQAKLLEMIRERLNASTVDAATTQENATESTTEKKQKKRSAKELRKAADEVERQQLDSLDTQVKQLRDQQRKFTHAMLMVDRQEKPPATFVLFQGDYKSPRQEVTPGVISALDPNPLRETIATRAGSSGRRLALANWITSPQNPLTARVIVNRVWQQLFGQGLVRTPGDFGLAGLSPDDPELLDWLAIRFVEDGWSLKRLVRMIVLSATYQQASCYHEPPAEVAHVMRRPRRLTAEQLRDSMLFVSGILTDKSSGAPIWPSLPTEVLEANPAFLDDNETKTKGWYPSAEQDQHCRSIFLVQKRNTRVPMLEVFDQPENSVSCTRRSTSVVAPQALALLNNAEAIRAAEAMADRVSQGQQSPAEQIKLAFLLALQRSPSATELAACQQMLADTSLKELCRVLLNINEFAFAD